MNFLSYQGQSTALLSSYKNGLFVLSGDALPTEFMKTGVT
jgi:hypothetical protein